MPDPSVDAAIAPLVDPCAHARVPPRPNGAGESKESKGYWLAAERIIVPFDAVDGVKSGLDLDESCTCQRDLRDGAPSCETKPATCDFDGGIDDAFTALAAGLPTEKLFDPGVAVNKKTAEGRRTLLFYIERYNGEANDSDVGLALVGSGGLYSDLGCDDAPRGRDPDVTPPSEPDAPGDRYSPAWDGCDRWSPFLGQTIGKYPDVQPVATTKAYVADGRLVASVDAIGLNILGESARMRSGYLVAKLEKTPQGGLTMDGFVTGRIPFADVVNIVGRTEARTGPGTLTPLCETSYWPLVGSTLCSARDLAEDPSRDGKGDPCNAMSAAIGFVAHPVRVSDVIFSGTERAIACDASVVCP